MASILPPQNPDPVRSTYQFRVALGARTYVYTLRYLARLDRWFMDLADGEGTVLARGVRVVCDVALFSQQRKARPDVFPDGQLVALSVDQDKSPPGLDDLGTRVLLFFVPLSDLPEVVPGVTITIVPDPGNS